MNVVFYHNRNLILNIFSLKRIIINGQNYFIKEDINLFDLVTYFNYNDHLLVLEHNNLVQSKKTWKDILIKNQDKIEIVTIVGGG